MKEKLIVQLYIDSKLVAECDNIHLEECATKTGRRFIFKNLTYDINFEFIYKMGYRMKVNVHVSFLKKGDNIVFISNFNILVLDTTEIYPNSWGLYGIIESEEEYDQDVINVFDKWQKQEKIDWFSCTTSQKESYLYACLIYSSLSSNINKRKKNQIDVSLVKEYRDFLYLISISFFGERGYIGYNFYTFCDCLLEIYHSQKDYFKGCSIEFINSRKIQVEDDKTFFQDLIKELTKYGCSVVLA